jgi:hypothetical protein
LKPNTFLLYILKKKKENKIRYYNE